MLRLAFLGIFLAFRDLVFTVLPEPGLFRASDVGLFAGLFLIRTVSGRGSVLSRIATWVLCILSAAAAGALGLDAFIDIVNPRLELALWSVCPLLVVALAVFSIVRREDVDTTEDELVRKTWIPLALGSLL